MKYISDTYKESSPSPTSAISVLVSGIRITEIADPEVEWIHGVYPCIALNDYILMTNCNGAATT